MRTATHINTNTLITKDRWKDLPSPGYLSVSEIVLGKKKQENKYKS